MNPARTDPREALETAYGSGERSWRRMLIGRKKARWTKSILPMVVRMAELLDQFLGHLSVKGFEVDMFHDLAK